MSAENEPVKCQEWLGDDSMTITSGTIIAKIPILTPEKGAVEFDGHGYYKVLPSGARAMLGVDLDGFEFDGSVLCKTLQSGEKVPVDAVPIGATAHMSEIEKELDAWRKRFPEYAYNSESGLICYKVSAWEEEN